MRNTKRRKTCECMHHFVSSFDGSEKCGMFVTMNLGGEKVRIHMTGDCNGVCDDWKEDKKEGANDER